MQVGDTGSVRVLKYGSYLDIDSSLYNWESSDNRIAKVDKNGNVTAVSAGEVLISVSRDGIKDQIKINVVKKLPMDLNKSELSLKKGETSQLTVTDSIEEFRQEAVKWSSSDKAVAEVDEKGNVTAKGVGTAYIHARMINGSGRYAQCRVTVSDGSRSKQENGTNKGNVATSTAGNKKQISEMSRNLVQSSVDTKFQLTYETQEDNTIIITGYKGTATGNLVIPDKIDGKDVTAIGSNAFNNCSGLQGKLILPNKLKKVEEGTFYSCGFSGDLVIPDGVDYIGSSAFGGVAFNGKLVLPQSLKVIGHSAFESCGFTGKLNLPKGLERIEVMAFIGCNFDGISDISSSLLNDYRRDTLGALGLDMSSPEHTLNPGATTSLHVEAAKKDITTLFTKWSSSNPKVAKVDQNGKVTALTNGTAVITAERSRKEKAVAFVTVAGEAVIHASSVSLNKSSLTLKKNTSYQLKAAMKPSNVTNKAVQWTSSNSKVVTVDSNGKVTAKGNGTAYITAKAADGSGKYARCKVVVPYNITYKLNYGKNSSKNPSIYYSKSFTLSSPSRKGYTFKGWYKDSRYKYRITKISASSKRNYTLYAKWEKVRTGQTKITSLKNVKGRKAYVSYAAVSRASGYQLVYSLDKSFRKGNVYLKSAKRTMGVRSLKAGKMYYVKVRAYRYDSTGNRVYGKYSGVKKIKIVR